MKAVQTTTTVQWSKVGAGIAGLFTVFVLLAGLYILNLDIIYSGVSIEGIDVSGKTRQQAVELLETHMEPLLEREKLAMTYNGDTWDIELENIGGSFDYMEAVREAYETGRTENLPERIREILKVRKEGKDIPLRFRYDVLALRAFIEGIDRLMETSPVNASMTRTGDSFDIIPGRAGVGVDCDLAVKQIDLDLADKDFKPKTLPIIIKEPEIKTEMLEQIDSKWGQFYTVFNTQAKERSSNLKIAADSIEGRLIKPGEVFSFNGVTGLRIEENGYQEAPVIFEGELVPGIGGGVCQVSSTLYNAVLYSNLEIVERHNHTIPSAYITMGRDATVTDRYLDLRFRNNSDSYIYIASWIEGNRIYAAVYGKKREEDIKVNIRTEIIQQIETTTDIVVDPSLMPGESIVEKEERKGYRIKAYRQVIKDGVPETDEVLSVDFYRPEKGLIRMAPDVYHASTETGVLEVEDGQSSQDL